jgi:hypothetical protein
MLLHSYNVPFNFTSGQTIGNRGNASAAIILNGGAQKTQLTQFIHDISVKDYTTNEKAGLLTIRGKNLSLYSNSDIPSLR